MITLLTTFALLLITSCTKEQFDDADSFVGKYSVSVIENATWGHSSGTTTDTGTMIITKLSKSKVQLKGFLNTYGEIVGNSIYMESVTSYGADGYLTTVFSVGNLNSNVLTFTANMSGQLADNGTLYPFRSFSQFTAIKQY